MNVVDSLIVTLQLDASGFNKRIQDTTDALDKLEKQGAKGSAFTALQRNQKAALAAVEAHKKALEELKKKQAELAGMYQKNSDDSFNRQKKIADMKKQLVSNVKNHLPITFLSRDINKAEADAKNQDEKDEQRQNKANEGIAKHTEAVEASQKKANEALSKQEDGLKKLDTTSSKTLKNMEHQGKSAANALNKIKYEVFALTSAFIGMNKIMSFISDQTSKGFALGNLAKNINIDVKTLSAWENIAEKYGATAQDVAQSFSEVSAGYEAAVMGGDVSDEIGFLSRYVSLKDSEGKRRDLEAVMLDAATFLQKTEKESGREKAVWFGKKFGFNEGMTNTLLGITPKELEAQKKRNAANEEDKKATEARAAAWSKITDVFERFGLTLLTTVTPVFTDLAARFTKWAASEDGQKWLKKVTDGFEQLIIKLRDLDWNKFREEAGKVWDGFVHAVGGINDLIEAVGGLSNALIILFALFVADKAIKLLSFLGFLAGFTPIGRMAKLIALLAAGIGGAAITRELLKADEGEETPGAPAKKKGGLTAKGVLTSIWTVLSGISETIINIAGGVAHNIAAPKDLFGRQKKAIDILKQEGMTQAEAEAFTISAVRESHLIPTAKSDNSTSYGVGQWLKKRQKDYEKKYGHSMQSVTDERQAFDEQFRFMAWEAKNTESGGFNKIQANPTAEAVTEHYFRPAKENRAKDWAKDAINRKNYEENSRNALINPNKLGENSPETKKNKQATINWAKTQQEGDRDKTQQEGDRTLDKRYFGINSPEAKDIKNNLNGANIPTANRTQSQSVTIGNVVVNTRATDAVAISKDIAGALKHQLFAANANTAFV